MKKPRIVRRPGPGLTDGNDGGGISIPDDDPLLREPFRGRKTDDIAPGAKRVEGNGEMTAPRRVAPGIDPAQRGLSPATDQLDRDGGVLAKDDIDLDGVPRGVRRGRDDRHGAKRGRYDAGKPAVRLVIDHDVGLRGRSRRSGNDGESEKYDISHGVMTAGTDET